MSKNSDADMYICMCMYTVILRVCATHHNHTHTTKRTDTTTTQHTTHNIEQRLLFPTTRNTTLNRIFLQGS